MENDRGVVAGGLPGGWETRGDGAGSRETEIDGPGWDIASAWEGGDGKRSIQRRRLIHGVVRHFGTCFPINMHVLVP